jgi:GT2 family glycosyltransferase
LSPNDSYPQHVVTAVLVAHDGAAWLPRVLESFLDQTRPVQRVVAVDTGSRDRSGAMLAGGLGQAVVFGMDRATGYAAAVTRALQDKAASVSVPGVPGTAGSERTEWIWLLHDDCELAPDALEQLLRGAAETPAAAVLGPKVRDLADRGVILEAGVTIDTVGRRITGIEPREFDQGQHDGDRDVLAAGSAGMLIRRDVWDQVGGFDTGMALFMEDVDFCWRAHAAGYRVRVITDAVVYHARAATRHRRAVSAGRSTGLLDRRNSLLTLLGNLPAGPMLLATAGNAAVSALRTLFFLVAKRPSAALDELGAVVSVLGHPVRMLKARRLRSSGRRAAYGRLHADLPQGRSVRRLAEFAAAAMSSSSQANTVGSHHATDDPADDDYLLTDTGVAQRILTSPIVLLLAALTVIAVVSERTLLSGGPLGGGALMPAWGGAAGLWHEYLQGFHPTGVGSTAAAPPYLVIVAAVATLLGGKPWLAVDVILLCCVPLAGLTAYLAARSVTRVAAIRVWAAASYALLPIAMGAVAAGRLAAAAVFVLLPLIALLAGRVLTEPRRRARRAAWATGLVLAAGAAFVPLLWVIALIAALAAALIAGRAKPGLLANLGIAVVVPPVLLLPWTAQVATQPSALLLEPGLHPPGLATPGLAARFLLLLSPGGPGLPAFWVTAGLVLAALAALLASRRRGLIMTGWGVALLGLLIALVVSRLSVAPAAGGARVTPWPGVPLAIAAVGLLLAGCAAADALPRPLAGPGSGLLRGRSVRGAAVAVVGLLACSAPVLAAAFWVTTGASGPVAPVGGQVVPELVIVSSGNGLQLRTLVLRSAGGQVSYSLLRASSPSLADPDLAQSPAAQRALNAAVAALAAPGGGDAVDQGQLLAQFDIGFVLMRAPVNTGLARQLDGVAGLSPVSTTSAFQLWRLDSLPTRVRVLEAGGTVVPVPSGQLNVSGTAAPAAGGTLELAEPAGGWNATLNGRPLASVRSPAGGWAQAFRLPPGGGTLEISRNDLSRDLLLALELIAFVVVAVLALPGVRAAGQDVPAPVSGEDSENSAEEGQPASSRHQGAGRRRGGRGRARPGRTLRRSGPDRDGPSGPAPSRRPAPQRVAAAAGAGLADTGEEAAGEPHGQADQADQPEPAEGTSSPHRDWAAGQPASRNTGQSAALAGARAGHDEAAGGDSAPGDAAYQRQPYSGEPYEGESYQRPPSVRSQSGEWPAADEESRYAAPGRYPLPGEYPLPSQYSRPVRSRQREDSRPAGEQAPEGEPSWPTPDEFSAWPSEQSSGWPPEDPQPGWTSGNGDGDALDPLPRAGKARVGRRSTAGDVPPRWPAPESDTEGDNG